MTNKGYEGKRLIVEHMEDKDVNFKYLTYLAADKKGETLYMVNKTSDDEITTYELATSAEELTKIRDLLINVVSKIENNYGLEQSIKILKGAD